MLDINKQIAYWRDGAAEDWQVSQELFEHGRIRYSLFFSHLALEKILKAHVCRHTQDLAPRIHNLVRLAELASVSLLQSQIDVLAKLNAFNIEGRYPDIQTSSPSRDVAQEYLNSAGEIYQWLMNQLSEQ
jgi:HEPN domain-containing protein